MIKVLLSTLLLLLILAVIFIFYPFLHSFTLPVTHSYRKSPHPQSPHTPPSSVIISGDQISQYHGDGFLVVRNVLSDDIIQLLNIASQDLRANKTLHCNMAYYSGPPIFHKYPHFCMWPDKIHDYFRDALYYSPLASIASQLMNNSSVRLFSTFTMGAEADTTIPQAWHADFPVFTGTDRCDNGLVMWLPLEQDSVREANGMIFARGSHRDHLEVVR